MARMSKRAYELRVMIAMTIYVALLLLAWPLSRDATDLWAKAMYSLAPVVPVLYVIWLLAQRVIHSDELEQRTHLIGLGVSSAVVSVLSLVIAFLALGKVMAPDWAAIALLWVFPLMMLTYAFFRSYASRRYGSDGECSEGGSTSPARFFYIAIVMCLLAAYLRFKSHNDYLTGMACGMAFGIAIVGVTYWLRRRVRKPTA